MATARPKRSANRSTPRAARGILNGDPLLRDVLDSVTGGVIALDGNWHYVYVNAYAARVVGRTPEELIGRSLWDVVPHAIDTPWGRMLWKAMLEQRQVHFEAKSDLVNRTFEYHVYPTHGGIAVYANDVSERKAMERELQESEARFSSVISAMSEGVLVVSSTGVITLCNTSAEEILGLERNQVVGRPAHELPWTMVHADTGLATGESHAIRLSQCTGIDLREVPMGLVGPDGQSRWLSVNTTPLFHAGNGTAHAVLATFADVTDRKLQEQRIQQDMNEIVEYRATLQRQKIELEAANECLAKLAVTDGLTGLKNHRAFRERLQDEFRRARRYKTPLSLIMLDVDHFKQFNDRFGHPAGDDVLKAVARLLEDSARSTDLVARYGGEEFALILPNTDQSGAISVAERIRASIAGAEWPLRAVTGSLGTSSVTEGTRDEDHLIAEADSALYMSKQRGRNRATHAADLSALAA